MPTINVRPALEPPPAAMAGRATGYTSKYEGDAPWR
jgi:hypothetical protein